VGLTVAPVDPAAVTDYLESSAEGPERAADWLEIRHALRDGAAPPAVVALRTPLMVSLARQIYNPGDGDLDNALPAPSELLNRAVYPDVRAIGEHLFDAYVRAAYRPRPSRRWPRIRPDDAERWLISLARHQEATLGGSTDIEWWRFDQEVPHAARAFFGAFIGGINVGVRGLSQQPAQGIGWSTSAFLRRFTYLVGFWLVVGLILPIGLYPSLALGAAIGIVSGIVVGSRGKPVELPLAASPTEVLRRDRRVFWTFGPGFGLLAGTILASSASVLLGVTPAIFLIGLFGSFYAAAAAGMGKAAWGWFVLARCWWRLRGRAPLRSVRFLRDAHRRGVLRQVGAVWQFRHIDLQRRLASRDPDATTPIPPAA
jgi:hypothetical protein